ncbi:MAG: hypothetical protein AAGD14_10075 [Planctomycetota bacterium]
MLRATAPTRVDLAGGTLDIWPICHLLHKPGCTVNVALNRRAVVEIEGRRDDKVLLRSMDREINVIYPADAPEHDELPLASRLVEAIAPRQPMTLRVRSTVPKQSGLGGSSAIAVAVGGALTAWTGEQIDAAPFLEFVQTVETRLLGVPTGYQDYYPAVYGGVQTLTATLHGVRRAAHPATHAMLDQTMLLVDTQLEHESGMNNWEVVRRFLDGDEHVRACMNRINNCAYAMDEALQDGNVDRAARALRAEWEARRQLAPVVSNERVEALLAAAETAGALAGKVCGAGGGGCIVLLAHPEKHVAIEGAVTEAGGAIVDFAVDPQGLEVTPE